MHSFTCEYSVAPVPFVEKTILILVALAPLGPNQLTIDVWVDLQILSSIPLTYMSDLESVLITVDL